MSKTVEIPSQVSHQKTPLEVKAAAYQKLFAQVVGSLDGEEAREKDRKIRDLESRFEVKLIDFIKTAPGKVLNMAKDFGGRVSGLIEQFNTHPEQARDTVREKLSKFIPFVFKKKKP